MLIFDSSERITERKALSDKKYKYRCRVCGQYSEPGETWAYLREEGVDCPFNGLSVHIECWLELEKLNKQEQDSMLLNGPSKKARNPWRPNQERMKKVREFFTLNGRSIDVETRYYLYVRLEGDTDKLSTFRVCKITEEFEGQIRKPIGLEYVDLWTEMRTFVDGKPYEDPEWLKKLRLEKMRLEKMTTEEILKEARLKGMKL